MSYNDHDHRGDYADTRHTHDHHDVYDVAEEHHRHYDLENLIEGLRADLNAAMDRIAELERTGE